MAITKDAALKYKEERTHTLKASTIEAVDVNNPEDFYMANLIQSGLREKNNTKYNNVKNMLSAQLTC